MSREINSVRVIANKYRTIIYVNFDNGTFGQHSKDREAMKWIDAGLEPDELIAARKLALQDGKWTNYTKPREVAFRGNGHNSTEDARDDIAQYEKFCAEHPGRQSTSFESAHGLEG